MYRKERKGGGTMKYSIQHDRALDTILRHLELIEEDPSKVEWAMREGNLYRNGAGARAPLCDLLIGYQDKEGLCVEVKRSTKRKDRARLQLANGLYLMGKMGYEPVRQKIVYYAYRGRSLEHELVRAKPEDFQGSLYNPREK